MSWLTTHISLHSLESPREEWANGITHLVGAVLAVAGTVFLILKHDEPHIRVAFAVFGMSMVLLFSASTLYHLSPVDSTWKRLFRLMDHLSIFVLIAGTYTPVLTVIGTSWSYRTLALVWGLAITGMILKVIFWDSFKVWQVIFFLAMGWLAIFRIREIVAILPLPFVYMLLGAGVVYSLGTIVYGLKKVPYHHAVWHLFVLGGAGLFFVGIYGYL
ncbi:MAG: hemolysin III family protein [Alkalispirochaeta sp.]|jgi:hemolysin III